MSRQRSIVAAIAAWSALAAGYMIAADRSGPAMTAAAERFLASLTPEQRQQAVFPLDSEELVAWHYIPTEQFPRKGLTIKEMTPPQRKLAHDLLQAALSERGYMTATTIIELESVLKAIETAPRFQRDPERYFLSIFGTPNTRGAWAWRFEGHHMSLHFAVVNGAAVVSSPSFLGANPAEVREGPKKGLRALAAEEDAARALLASFNDAQRASAIISSVALNEIVTTNKVKADPLSPVGLAASDMTTAQRDLLMQLVDVYVSKMESDIAAARLDRVRKAGLEKIAFAWAGETEKGRKHYYRIQGPTFLVEYDNAQNDGNHIHSVWRDFDGDFGRDLLREHVRTQPH